MIQIFLFIGLDLLIAHYCQEKGCLPTMLTSPCLGGTPPPHVTLRQGPSTILHQAIAKGEHIMAINHLNLSIPDTIRMTIVFAIFIFQALLNCVFSLLFQ